MKTNIYIGVDPGGNGAACAFAPTIHKCAFLDLKLGTIAIRNWIQVVAKECKIVSIYIEDVHSLFGMSAQSNFSFGGNVKQIHTIFTMLDFKVKTVTPKIWQAKVGIPPAKKVKKGEPKEKRDIKKMVAELCHTKFPQYGLEKLIYGKRGGLNDGRSDALMIAYYNYLINNE